MKALIHNTKLAYVHLKAAENHLLCIQHELPNYPNNKFKDLQKAVTKCFFALEKELAKNGDLESIEDLIIEIHKEVESLI